MMSSENLKFWLIILCIILIDGELNMMFGVSLSL